MNNELDPDPLTLVQLTNTDPEVQEENETEEEVSQVLSQALSRTPNPNSNYHSGRSSFRCSPSIHGYPLISFSRLTSNPSRNPKP